MKQKIAESKQQTADRMQALGCRIQDRGWRRGQSILEYIMVAVAVALAITAVVTAVDKKKKTLMENTANEIAEGGFLYGL